LRLAEWDDHPNTLGHRLVADALYRALAADPAALFGPPRLPDDPCPVPPPILAHQGAYLMTHALIQTIKNFIMKEFLPGENPDELTETTPLISGGILDSIATLKLVMFMEEEYGVSFEPHEVDKENLDDLNSIVRLLCSKNPTVA
jgi:acyl carrier protein